LNTDYEGFCGDGKPVELTASAGSIQSLGYDENKYPNDVLCRWLIKASVGKVRMFAIISITKRGRLKTRDWKIRHQITGVENAGPENPAPTRRGGKRKTKLYGQPMGQFLQFIEITVSLIL